MGMAALWRTSAHSQSRAFLASAWCTLKCSEWKLIQREGAKGLTCEALSPVWFWNCPTDGFKFSQQLTQPSGQPSMVRQHATLTKEQVRIQYPESFRLYNVFIIYVFILYMHLQMHIYSLLNIYTLFPMRWKTSPNLLFCHVLEIVTTF